MEHSGQRLSHFITLKDIQPETLRSIIDLSKQIKAHPGTFSKSLDGKTLALIFQKTSTRTRVSFEVAMNQLGGHPLFLDWKNTNFTRGSIEDEVRSLERYVDGIMARMNDHDDLISMATVSRVPIINGLTNKWHPCQALADVLTMEEAYPDMQERKAAFIGDGANNVSSSFSVACALLGYHVSVVAPSGYSLPAHVVEWLKESSLERFIEETDDIESGVAGADIIYTDTFVSMGQESESRKRLHELKRYQVNEDLLKLTGKDSKVMHCLPAHRGVEITGSVLDSPASIVFDQAENRLHAQKGLLVHLFSKTPD
ncbi:MAG: ornithine carbamoyltransferase [Promethearchaeota archaeon]